MEPQWLKEKEVPTNGDQIPPGGSADGCWRISSPRLVYFSVTTLLIFCTAICFQIQLIELQKKLSVLKTNIADANELRDETQRTLKKRSCNRDGTKNDTEIEAVHLQGSLPFDRIFRNGKIGPWTLHSNTSLFSLLSANKEISIKVEGLYFVYAQVYYITSSTYNSFQIVSPTGKRKPHIFATCSTQGKGSTGEISCFTAFAANLFRGQRLYLNQVEQNRLIHFQNGCSFFGVILLQSHPGK